MQRILTKFAPDIFISTGGGGQFNPKAYRKLIAPFRDKIANNELIIASVDTTPGQVEFLRDGLATVNVGQKPYEMGHWAITLLNMHSSGQPLPLVINTGLTYCDRDNFNSCTIRKPTNFQVNQIVRPASIGHIFKPQG